MLDGIPLVQVGAGTLLTLVVLLILSGRLVPRRALDDAHADRDAWKKVALEQAPQLTQMLEYARTADAVLRSLPVAAARAREDTS